MWNLAPKPLRGTFLWDLYVGFWPGTFMTNIFAKRLCGTFLRGLGAYIWVTWELLKVGPLSGTSGNLTLYVEPELLRVGPLCGT